jgi:cytochrome b6-f complex iron-sulfur subunit
MSQISPIGSPEHEEGSGGGRPSSPARRGFLLGGLLAALAAAYGVFATYAIQFIFPKRGEPRRSRIFIGFQSDVSPGSSKAVHMPSGDQLLISNTGRINPKTGNTFVAFSNSCPHLGCKVHWEASQQHFVCPCHQGVFDANGIATSGPPAQSNSNLKPYDIEVAGNSIYAVVEEV